MQIYLLFAERKSDALQLKILIYRPKGTVCKGFRRKDRRFSYLQGEICGGRVLRASAGEGSARTARGAAVSQRELRVLTGRQAGPVALRK